MLSTVNPATATATRILDLHKDNWSAWHQFLSYFATQSSASQAIKSYRIVSSHSILSSTSPPKAISMSILPELQLLGNTLTSDALQLMQKSTSTLWVINSSSLSTLWVTQISATIEKSLTSPKGVSQIKTPNVWTTYTHIYLSRPILQSRLMPTIQRINYFLLMPAATPST